MGHLISIHATSRLKLVFIVSLLILMTACGGGGGNSGSSSGDSSTGTSGTSASTTVVASPTISVAIVDSSFATVTSNSVSGGATYYVQATLRDATGAAVASKLVSFSTDSAVATLAQSSALTNSSGVARVAIAPASISSSAAAAVTASATVSGTSVSGSLDYQTSAANVVLGAMTITTSNLSALQSTPVTVAATVNGSAALNGQVSVSFSASCGSFSPSSAATNGSGVAASVYQSAVSCSGPVTLSAQASGAALTSTGAVTITAAQPTNVVFSTATPSTMVTSQASGGKQSSVVFRVLDQTGGGMSGQQLDIDLSGAAIAAGVRFVSGGSLTSTTQVVTTDGSGNASVTVTSGTMPTPVQVTAKLHSNTALLANSTGLTVASGVPAQDAASLAAETLALDAFRTDGVSTKLTWSVSDRQGNPIAPGSVVNFVTRSGGILVSSCTLDSSSRCSVTYTSAGTRPSNGRVVILAFMDGEESFTDLDGDNVWDAGEPFSDIGTMYMDENEDANYVTGEQTYPGGMVGSSACSSGYSGTSVANTCDGSWSSSVKVRQRIVLALSDGDAAAVITQLANRTVEGFTVRIADSKGNSMPTGTTVAATVVTPSSACAVSSVSPNKVPNSPNASNHVIVLNGHANCTTATVSITVTTPKLVATTVTSSF